MEQKEIFDKFYIQGTATLRSLLQCLSQLSSDKLNAMLEHQFPLKGETGLYKLLNSKDKVTSQFLNQKVDLNKVKEALKEQGLPFAFKETNEGTNVYFKTKDSELAKTALERIFTSITNEPNVFANKVLKDTTKTSFKERLEAVEKDLSQNTSQQVEEILEKGGVSRK